MSDNVTDLLTAGQAIAVQMEFAGANLKDIAEACGVSRTTLWEWRKDPAYIDELALMREDARRETVGKAVALRTESLGVVTDCLAALKARLGSDDLSPAELVSTSKAALDVYKTVAAQTGIAEETRVTQASTVQVSVVESVARELLDDE